jgi:transposase, IS30 family
MRYTHLTPLERTELYRMRVLDKKSISSIAKEMNRSVGTISRELKRNLSQEQIYLPDTAQKLAEERRHQSKEKFGSVSESTIKEIRQHLENCYSPEQLSGRMKLAGKKSVSYETIYQMIYADHKKLGICKQYLRQKQKRRRRKGSKQKRCIIPGRIGIEERPAIADKKTEIGHWESDTMIGCNHDGVVVTHVDKASKYLVAGLAKNKTMEQINQVTIGLFENIKQEHRITMTFDNGREFCGHQKIGEKLELDTFFARPYHSWERGLNEHTNGLIRQFFPKDTNFKTVKPEEFQRVVDLINHRPRKSLGYRTPYEVFYSISVDAVALQI